MKTPCASLLPTHAGQFAAVCRWTLLGLALTLLQSARAASTLPFYEPFPETYTEGEQLGASGSSGLIWDFGNSTSSSCARIADAAALSFPGLTNTGTSKGLMARVTGSGAKNRGASLTLTTGVTLYASCLLNFQYITNNGPRPVFGLSTSSSGSSVSLNGAVVYVDNQGRLMIAKNSATPAAATTYPLSVGSTYLVVLRYKYNSGSAIDDEVDLWLNPTSLGNNGALPVPTLSTTANSDVNAIGSVAYYQNSSYPPLLYLDEIRVGYDWASVTPPACVPSGTAFNVTGGGTVCVGAGFPVGLSGSEVGVDYWLLTNGGFSGIVVSGTGGALGFGTQSTTALYTVFGSNTTSTCTYWMTGGASVSNLNPPSIVTQPIAVNVVSGSVAAFSVVAAGDGLTYQWRKNGVNLTDTGNVSGSTTPNLVLSPATAADVASAGNGYDVVITGACTPPATSARVGLALISASDLLWYGDGVSNLWDVGISADWSTGAAIFNNGDRVTFDDTAIGTTVSLVSSFLNPASINFAAGGTYTFSGTGSIIGQNTSLLVSGAGTFTLANGVNTFGGGITLSNGLLSFSSPLQLGTGAITLAGGTLDALNVQGLTINNPVNLVTDSTINVHNTSTSALVFTNILSGTAGTLNIVNATTGRGPTIHFSYPGFTFNQPIVLNLGASGTNLIMLCDNPSGSQVFNGVISGGGSVRRNASGGATVLNGTNTYTLGFLLSNGALGVGADSVSAFPPTIDSSPLGTGPLQIDTGAGTPALFAAGGARTLANPVVFASTALGPAFVIFGSNALTLSGTFDLNVTNRTIRADNTGGTTISGVISDDNGLAQGITNGLTKIGTNTLTLSGINTYQGATVVSNGTLLVNGQLDIGGVTVAGGVLGGTGTILGPVVVQSGAALAPGASVGTLTINSDLTLAGNLFIEVNKSGSPTSDKVAVSGALANIGAGTLTVSNLGPALAKDDSFTLFNKPLANGNALSVVGAGVTWTNKLALDGTIAVLASVPTSPTNLTFSYNPGAHSVTLAWPVNYVGWTLVAQTNALGLGLVTNESSWFPVPGSTTVNQMVIPANPANGTVFYRMRLPKP